MTATNLKPTDRVFLYRRGNGNDGCYPRLFVRLKPTDCPYAALRALVANDYIAGKRVRRHIIRTVEVDGEAEFGLSATVLEGPKGETEFGAAWLCAELNAATWTDKPYPGFESGCWHSEDNSLSVYDIREVLDRGALRLFRERNRP